MGTRIGLGVTRMIFKSRDYAKIWDKANFSEIDSSVIVYDDPFKREGIAKKKNECLRKLMEDNCDHFFLLDDDTFPVAFDWCKVFIEAAQAQDQHHLMYINPNNYINGKLSPAPHADVFGNLLRYQHSHGCMMYFDRECIETCGGYNEEFDTYGYEHSELSQRICNMQMTSFPFMTIRDVEKYIWACDFDGLPEGIEPEPKIGIPDLESKLAKNALLYQKMMNSDKKIPL
jgi:hypothetical protein